MHGLFRLALVVFAVSHVSQRSACLTGAMCVHDGPGLTVMGEIASEIYDAWHAIQGASFRYRSDGNVNGNIHRLERRVQNPPLPVHGKSAATRPHPNPPRRDGCTFLGRTGGSRSQERISACV